MRSIGWLRELRGGRLLGLFAVAIGLLAVTALASREPLSTLGKTGGAASGGLQIDVSPVEFALIAAGGLIVFIAIFIYSGGSRRTPVTGFQRLLLQIVVMLTPLVAALLIASGLAGSHRRGTPLSHGSGLEASPHRVSPHPASFTIPSFATWGVLGIVVVGVLLFVVGVTVRPRPRGGRTLPSAMESAAAAALTDLDTIADPRLAIIAAYRRMEQTLGEAGFPRAAPEAPREYLGRVASVLEIDPKPLGTLTALFEAAKFSLRQLDAGARQRAITALHALQAQLA